MLSIKFPKAFFPALLVLLIIIPTVSYQRPKSIVGILENVTDSTASSHAPKLLLNKQAVQFVQEYIRRNTECFEMIRSKRTAAFSMMDSVFCVYDLPVELKYLAVVESELNPRAISRVGAVGPWQFMPGTAKDLGLKISRKYDERTNFKKSTKAAALYLRDLYSAYGDWLLVLAAYNCGPVPVNAAIRKSGSRNFWRLQSYLPAETRGHVKKFIATHYYFEGKGSVATLTKAEYAKYMKEVAAIAAKEEEANKIQTFMPAENADSTQVATQKTVVRN
jgi:membrane-bound lytic murein transglycosylase D